MSKCLPLLLLLTSVAMGCTGPSQAEADSDHVVFERPPAGASKADGVADDEFSRGNLWYHLSLSDGSLDARVRLYSPPSMTRFFLPGAWAGRSDFANRIRIAGASGPTGPRFLTIDRRDGRVDVESEDAEWVELHYRVDLDDDADERLAPRYASGVLRAFGPTFLVLPAQQVLDRSRDIPIELHLPSDWPVLATWDAALSKPSRANPDTRVHGFIAPDGRALRDAFLVAGPGVDVIEQDGEITVGFDRGFKGDRAGIARAIERAVIGFRAQFGDLGPTRVYVDTESNHGDERAGGLGRRGGFVLELPGDARVTPSTQLIITHEALHLWNGHHLVPDPSQEAELRWFKEGFTHYLAIRNTCRLRGFDLRDALEELARVVDNYERNPIVRGGTVRSIDRRRHPYDFGVLFAWLVDSGLVVSGGPRVETWLDALDKNLRADGKHYYDDGALYRSYRTLVGPSTGLTEAWSKHVRKSEPIDVSALLKSLGLHFIPSSAGAPRLIALDRAAPIFRRTLGECHDGE